MIKTFFNNQFDKCPKIQRNIICKNFWFANPDISLDFSKMKQKFISDNLEPNRFWISYQFQSEILNFGSLCIIDFFELLTWEDMITSSPELIAY